jgi:hypothetical protein
MEEKADKKPSSSPKDQPISERLRDSERSLKQEDKEPNALQKALDFFNRKR